jgi:hypothetical protein
MKRGAVNLKGAAQRAECGLPDTKPARERSVIGLGREPGEHHGADVIKTNTAAVMDDK